MSPGARNTLSRMSTLLVSLSILLCLGTLTTGMQLAGSVLGASEETVTLLATGDTMTSRQVGKRLRTVPTQPLYPFENILPTLLAADVAFTNLETPIIEGENTDPHTFQFRSDPDVARRLREANIQLVSIANNHMHDRGDAGVRRTIDVLQTAGVTFAGAGNEEQAYAPVYRDVKGIRIALLAYADPTILSQDARAAGDDLGVAVMDLQKLKAGIARARTDGADIVIVSMHGGTEYAQQPTNNQRIFAHAAVDDGADLVLGHHPHVPQASEVYAGKHILYSLGNFVFDQAWSTATMRSVIAKIVLTKHGVQSVDLLPIVIGSDYQPTLSPNH